MANNEFSIRLKRVMSDRNISQSELCKITNIPKSAMSQYLSGNFKPKDDRIKAIAGVLNVSEGWLLFGVDNTTNTKKETLTDDQVEMEIARLSDSEYVKLAKAEQRMKYRRRQYLYNLRHLEKRVRN